MKEHIAVTVGSQEYTFLVDDKASAQKVVDLVNSEMRQIYDSGRITDTECAVLCAMNMAERMLIAEQASENLRNQLKDYLDDVQKARSDAAEARRELSRMKNK